MADDVVTRAKALPNTIANIAQQLDAEIDRGGSPFTWKLAAELRTVALPTLNTLLAEHERLRAEKAPNGADLRVVRAAYGWTINENYELEGLTAGDMGYEPSGLKLDQPTVEWLKAADAKMQVLEASNERLQKANDLLDDQLAVPDPDATLAMHLSRELNPECCCGVCEVFREYLTESFMDGDKANGLIARADAAEAEVARLRAFVQRVQAWFKEMDDPEGPIEPKSGTPLDIVGHMQRVEQRRNEVKAGLSALLASLPPSPTEACICTDAELTLFKGVPDPLCRATVHGASLPPSVPQLIEKKDDKTFTRAGETAVVSGAPPVPQRPTESHS